MAAATSQVARTAAGAGAHPLAGAETPSAGVWDTPFAAPETSVPPGTTLALPSGLEGLHELALQGRWREVAAQCRGATATGTAAALSTATYHVLALAKLRLPAQAAAELARLGDLDDTAYAAPRAQGGASLAPFALRWLAAELPGLQGRQQETLDRLYSLQAWCQQQQAAAAATAAARAGPQGAGSGATTAAAAGPQVAGSGPTTAAAPAATPAAAAAGLWQRRARSLALALAAKHSAVAQHKAALGQLDGVLASDPGDAEAWTQAALVQLLLGDVAAAQQTLVRVEQMGGGGGGSGGGGGGGGGDWQRGAQLHRNRGLLLIAQQNFAAAAKELEGALRVDPGDALAANNLAVALTCSGGLPAAMRVLEEGFRREPGAFLQERIVTNLASMYELAADPGSADAKRRMAAWVAAAAPDDLDLNCTKT